MRLLLLLLAALPLMAQVPYRSLLGAVGKYGTVTAPNSAPWNNRTTIRFEFRLHDWTSTGRIFQWDAFVVSKAASTITATDFYDSGSPTVSADIPAGSTDIIVRIQRTPTTWVIELWKADGSLYVPGGVAATSAATFSLGGDDLTVMHAGGGAGPLPAGLAWFRAYSTSVSRDSAMPTNVTGGDLFDYEFEGNGTDSSANALNLTMTGSPTYPSTPVVPMIGEELTVGSGRSFTPTCAGTNADSYKWRQQGGPALSVAFSSQTTASPTVSGLIGFGQYTLTCEATINGVSGVSSLPVGVVATNDAGVIIPPDETIKLLLGPLLRAGVSDWQWYDRQRRQMGDFWYADTAQYTNNFSGLEAENYYDACLAQYANYYRTGLTRFQTAGRACADKWYSQYWAARAGAGTCGANWLAPRDSSMLGLAMRAYETGETAGGTMWTCLTAYANYHLDLWVEQRGIDNGYTSPYFGVREAAYSLINASAVAVANPNSGTRAAYAARLVTEMSNYVRGLQCQTGTVFQACTDSYTTGAGTITITNGSTAVTGSGSNFNTLFASATGLAIQDSGGVDFYLTVASKASDTSLTLSAPFSGSTSSGLTYASRTSTATARGNWRWEEPSSGLIGYGALEWHTGILIEAVERIYTAGIETTVSPVVANAYSDYMIATPRVFPTFTCTGAFGNPQARRIVYSVWFGNGDQGLGCSSDQDIKDQRQQNSLPASVPGFSYFLSATAGALTFGDDMWSSTYGEWIGPGVDGWYGLLNETSNTGASRGKMYGQSSRNGSYLAFRLGSAAANTAPVAASITVSVKRSAVPTATKVRVTITQPSGSTATNTCSADSCTVTGLDTRQGSTALMRLEYLSSGDVVLASGDQQLVPVV